MRNEIWATLYHKISAGQNPQHEKCPTGEDSWCSWQRARANNTLKEYSYKSALSIEVFKAMKKIYVDLSAEELLSRCLGAYTQNSNESFNSVVWTITPKTISSGKRILDMGCDIAIVLQRWFSRFTPNYESVAVTDRQRTVQLLL